MPRPKSLSKVRDALVPLLDETTRSKKRNLARHREEAERLRHLEYRSEVAKLHHEKGMTINEVARTLHISTQKVRWYLDWSLERVLTMPEDERKKPKRRNSATPVTAVVTASSSTPVVLDPKLSKQAFFLRTQAVPVDEIAELLGVTESEASAAIYEYANKLNNSEINNTETARRVQIEQLDVALRAIMPYVTGKNLDGSDHPIDVEQIDRFLKITDQKAKLTGINTPQRVDLDVRLRKIAEAGEFDLEDLQTLLRDVLEDYPMLGLPGGNS